MIYSLDAWQESLRDIKPVHTWDGELGEHRPGDFDPEREQLVLLVRGDLLRKYPTAVIYAEKARRTGPGGAREPDSATVKLPLFRGTLPPDVTFVGFDLTRD